MTDPRVIEAVEKIDAGIGRQHRHTSVVDPRRPGIVNVIEHPECEVCVARSELDTLLAVIRKKDEALRRAIELEFHLVERAQVAESKLEQAREGRHAAGGAVTDKPMKRLVLLVAKTDLDTETMVVGAWEQGILDIMGYEEVERIQNDMKEAWYPDATEWREVLIDVPEKWLLAAFQKPAPIVATKVEEKGVTVPSTGDAREQADAPPELMSECPECGGNGFHTTGYWEAEQCDRCRMRPESWAVRGEEGR